MEKTKFKGPRFERRLNMKGSKKRKKERGLGVWREDWEHWARVKSMQRGSRTLSTWEEDWKHQVRMESTPRRLKALGVHWEHVPRMDNT